MTLYYQDEAVTIWHGDCSDYEDELTKGTRLITDPPYGFSSYATDTAPDLGLLSRLIASSQTAAIFGYPELLVAWCVELKLVPDEWVTWWPTNGGAGRAKHLPREQQSIAVFGEVCGARRLTRPRTNLHPMFLAISAKRGTDPYKARLGDVWRTAAPGRGGFGRPQHPNEKPAEVMSNLVELCSNPGDSVLDPFMGSGTTLVAAKLLGRRAIGIEIEEKFCEIAAQRCSQEVLAVA